MLFLRWPGSKNTETTERQIYRQSVNIFSNYIANVKVIGYFSDPFGISARLSSILFGYYKMHPSWPINDACLWLAHDFCFLIFASGCFLVLASRYAFPSPFHPQQRLSAFTKTWAYACSLAVEVISYCRLWQCWDLKKSTLLTFRYNLATTMWLTWSKIA